MVSGWPGSGLTAASLRKPVFISIGQALVLRVVGHPSAADLKTPGAVINDASGQPRRRSSK